ncbi:glycosyltransferase family 2 protein [Bacillus sp. MRMR6]|uniref:glycosyltransferase family 2 protein n=1 Tax=Bacillus sp. MRMR6 TaxID=1928617 RepID=UPI0009518DCF|nr:glycosyltransferase family 2 protein [Bacillus sp. MRMR6]OLS41095.1 hypothetical protein BTR25_04300 [Bacillus sp. MRMR6]
MKKVSIIVPVYQVERYLRKCLDSIVNQTYRDLEIILVDDGSNDDSGSICDEYSIRDSRIKVIHQQNIGLSGARNKGIEIATGAYISFIDSDDYVEPSFIEELYKSLVNNKAQISVCNISQENEDMSRDKLLIKNINTSSVFNNFEGMKNLLQLNSGFMGYVWNKLYDITLFKDIRFPVSKIYEDTFTVYKLFSKSDQIVYTNATLYHYVNREGSITSSKNIEKKVDFILANKQRYEFIKNEYKGLDSLAFTTYCISVISILNEYIKYGKSTEDIEKHLKNVQGLMFEKKYKDIPVLYRAILFLTKTNFSLYKRIINQYYLIRK